MPIDYVITIRGHLDEHWSTWFEGLTITNHSNREATLTGPVADQASLHGLLIKIRDLGLPLIAIAPANAECVSSLRQLRAEFRDDLPDHSPPASPLQHGSERNESGGRDAPSQTRELAD